MLEAVKYRGATNIATSEFEYNAFGKVTEATETILDADAVEIGYDYDQLGNLTGITYPDANDITIDREALGRIDTIKLDGDTIASYQYVGHRVKRRSYNSPSVTYDIDYNGLGRATRYYTYKTGADIADFGYTFDDNGNITEISFDHRSGSPDNDFTYDDLDRLTRVDYLSDQNDNEQFTYDDLGNRLEVDLRDGTTDTYARNELTNRYDDDQGEDIVCDYDNAGNMTKDPNGYECEYDYENRLIKITKNSGGTTVAEFEYDALGRRIEKTDSVANETTRYYYDNEWRVLAEYDDNDTQLRDFIYGNFIDETLILTDSTDTVYYYAHNHIYSVVALIDENGNVVERYEYNAYGLPTIYNNDYSQTYDTSQFENPYFFTGRNMDLLDNDSKKLGYNRLRYLDYYTGRWLSHDPLGITPNPQKPNRFAVHDQYKDGMNIYQYVQSRPFKEIDSYGLDIVSPWNPPVPETSNNYYSLYKLKKCGTCGPDITGMVRQLRRQLFHDYNNWTESERFARCWGRWGTSHERWDVLQLYDPALITPSECGTNGCNKTVMVHGRCYPAEAVNYYMWGVMALICEPFENKGYVDVHLGLLWPLIVSKNYDCKKKWALAGYRGTGSTSGIICKGYESCKKCSKSPKVPRLTYKWGKGLPIIPLVK